jgi:hypothetical protein
MATKTYTHENVTYEAHGRRWDFKATVAGSEIYSYGTSRMPGGRVTADKVARVINGAVKRNSSRNDIDNLARANMNDIFHRAKKAVSRVVTPIGTFVK